MHTIAERKLLMLRPGEILPARDQPRRSFDEYELKSLADSIAASGIIQPISVRKNEKGEYELIAGERRLRAAKMAGLRRVPCILHRTDDATAAFYAVVENLQRSDLNPFEEAESIRVMLERYGLSQTEAAIRLGIAQSTLSNKLRLLKLAPEVQERMVAARLTERHARALLKLDPARHGEALDRIIAGGLTLQQTEELVREMTAPAPEKPAEEPEPLRRIAIGDLRLFANSLYRLVDTMQSAGISVGTRKVENDLYIEYKVRINKESLQNGCRQLTLC